MVPEKKPAGHRLSPERQEYMREYRRLWMRRRRADYFDGKVCAHCGSDGPLELDHIDPELKVHHAIWSWRADRRNAELAKCQPLCTECHKTKTFLQTHGERSHGEVRMYKRGGCRCQLCVTANTEYRRSLKQNKRAA